MNCPCCGAVADEHAAYCGLCYEVLRKERALAAAAPPSTPAPAATVSIATAAPGWTPPVIAAALALSAIRELSGLNQVFEHALSLKLIKGNPIANCGRLPTSARKQYWLRRTEIAVYLAKIPDGPDFTGEDSAIFRDLAEFLVLTGARFGEALLFNQRNVDWERREISIITFKKRGKGREEVYRYLSIDSLGPRFIAILRRLKPHPKSGFFFAGRRGRPLPYPWAYKHHAAGVESSGFTWLRPHDLRHTFAMHRAIVVRDFRQLQMELGHEDPASVQSYLDNTARMRREDSIFHCEWPPHLDKKAFPSYSD